MVTAIAAGVALAGGAIWSSATADAPAPRADGPYIECMRGMRGTADTLEHWSFTCVIGDGPNAVYLAPSPTVGGDPAIGETEESYLARTGHDLPGRASAVSVADPWWYGPAPVVGGDPASGETEASYHARTGHHLPGRYSATVDTPSSNEQAPSTGGDPAPGETDDSYFARTGQHLPADG
jgi:hypothetical protein